MVKKKKQIIIGWREWIALPDLEVDAIKAKVDTGARSSALHVTNLKYTTNEAGEEIVSFKIHPIQNKSKPSFLCQAKVVEHRKVKSSNGETSVRPVILTKIKLGEDIWQTEVTLVNRDLMSFRMLIGRQSLRRRILVHPKKSFLLSEEEKGEL